MHENVARAHFNEFVLHFNIAKKLRILEQLWKLRSAKCAPACDLHFKIAKN